MWELLVAGTTFNGCCLRSCSRSALCGFLAAAGEFAIVLSWDFSMTVYTGDWFNLLLKRVAVVRFKSFLSSSDHVPRSYWLNAPQQSERNSFDPLRTNVLFVLKFSHVLLLRRCPASSRNDPTITAKPKLYNALCTYILRFSVCCSTYDKQNGKNGDLSFSKNLRQVLLEVVLLFCSHKFEPLFTFDMLDFFFSGGIQIASYDF